MTEKEINKIVSENLNYVKSVANQYKGKGVEFDDLVSEGTLAMLMAARKFQPDSYFASPRTIEGEYTCSRHGCGAQG